VSGTYCRFTIVGCEGEIYYRVPAYSRNFLQPLPVVQK
jgi:hypothetical protein